MQLYIVVYDFKNNILLFDVITYSILRANMHTVPIYLDISTEKDKFLVKSFHFYFFVVYASFPKTSFAANVCYTYA